MSHSKRRFYVLGALAGFLACGSNPTEPDHDHQLNYDFAISTTEIQTLQEVTFTVTVTDDHGDAVTDFAMLDVEYELEGTGTWRPIALTLQGSAYVASHTFVTSGEYHFRVAGMRGNEVHGVLHEVTGHYEIERAYVTQGDFRIEFESFPGHLHEGEMATMRFWILEKDKNASDVRPPVTGLTATIRCGNPDASNEQHAVTDSNNGIYEAPHTFMGHGEGHLELTFTDANSMQWLADFHVHVVAGH